MKDTKRILKIIDRMLGFMETQTLEMIYLKNRIATHEGRITKIQVKLNHSHGGAHKKHSRDGKQK